MTKRTRLVALVTLCGLVFLAVVGAIAGPPNTSQKNLGYSELSNGRGGTNVEAFVVPDGFDKTRSLAAFKDTLYPLFAPTAPGAIARRINSAVELRLRCTRTST
jgi:hypothetical protein